MNYRIKRWRNGYDGGIMYRVQIQILGFLWIPRTGLFQSRDEAQTYIDSRIQKR